MTLTLEHITALAPNTDQLETPQTPTQPIYDPQTTSDGAIGVEVEQEHDAVLHAAQTIIAQREDEATRFAKIDIQAARDKTLTPLQKTVYMILCTYRNNKTGEAWPSKETIAEYAGCKPNAVRTAYRALEQAGYITTTKRYVNNKQTSNLICFPTLKPNTQQQTTTPKQTYPIHNQPNKKTNHKHPTTTTHTNHYQQPNDNRPQPQTYTPPPNPPNWTTGQHQIKQIKKQLQTT
jgi:DNA-binding transcriptional regulator YhcF (GntR family)